MIISTKERLNIPFRVEDSISHKGHKMITLDESLFELINTPIKTTYITIMPRMFGLSYAEFMRMVRDKYHGTLHGKEGGYITFTFKENLHANQFQMVLINRWYDIMSNN